MRLVRGGTVFAGKGGETGLEDGAVLIAKERIRAVGRFDRLRAGYPEAEVLGGPEFVIVPGLANAHDHARGFSPVALGVQDEPLELWLLGLDRPAPGSEYLRALWDGMRLIRSGVTTTNHCLNSGSLEAMEATAKEALRAYLQLGLRAGVVLHNKDCNQLALGDDELLARLPSELAGEARDYLASRPQVPIGAFLEFVDTMIDHCRAHYSDARILLGPGAPWRASDALLEAIRDYSRSTGAGIHMHLLETRHQREYGLRKYGRSLVKHLEQLDFLQPNLTVAHCVWATREDLACLARHGVMVSHNLSSNLRLRSGLAPLREMLQAGVTVGLGLDGLALNGDQDLWTEMRLVARIHSEPGVHGWSLPPNQLLRMAASNGAQATVGSGAPGSIEVDAPGDLVLLDLRAAAAPSRPSGPNPLGSVLSLASPACVDTVLISGRVVLRAGHFTNIDEEKVATDVQRALSEWRAVEGELPKRLRKYLASHYRDLSADSEYEMKPLGGKLVFDYAGLFRQRREQAGLEFVERASTASIYRLYLMDDGYPAICEYGPGGVSVPGALYRVTDQSSYFDRGTPAGLFQGEVVLSDGRRARSLLISPGLAEGYYRKTPKPREFAC